MNYLDHLNLGEIISQKMIVIIPSLYAHFDRWIQRSNLCSNTATCLSNGSYCIMIPKLTIVPDAVNNYATADDNLSHFFLFDDRIFNTFCINHIKLLTFKFVHVIQCF